MLDPASLCQIEVPVDDIPRALEFYAAAFGWRPAPAELHEYVVLEVPHGCPYGIALVPRRTGGTGAGVILYFACDDPEALVERTVAAGAVKRFGPMTLPGYGKIHQIEDPTGCRWGFFQRGAGVS